MSSACDLGEPDSGGEGPAGCSKTSRKQEDCLGVAGATACIPRHGPLSTEDTVTGSGHAHQSSAAGQGTSTGAVRLLEVVG